MYVHRSVRESRRSACTKEDTRVLRRDFEILRDVETSDVARSFAMGDDATANTDPRDETTDDDPSTWWGRLTPTSEDAIRARHVDRAASGGLDDSGRARGADAREAKTRAGGMMLRMRSSVVGRIVMNKEGTARAKTQPADIALDAASGAREATRGDATGCDAMGWDGMR